MLNMMLSNNVETNILGYLIRPLKLFSGFVSSEANRDLAVRTSPVATVSQP